MLQLLTGPQPGRYLTQMNNKVTLSEDELAKLNETLQFRWGVYVLADVDQEQKQQDALQLYEGWKMEDRRLSELVRLLRRFMDRLTFSASGRLRTRVAW